MTAIQKRAIQDGQETFQLVVHDKPEPIGTLDRTPPSTKTATKGTVLLTFRNRESALVFFEQMARVVGAFADEITEI